MRKEDSVAFGFVVVQEELDRVKRNLALIEAGSEKANKLEVRARILEGAEAFGKFVLDVDGKNDLIDPLLEAGAERLRRAMNVSLNTYREQE